MSECVCDPQSFPFRCDQHGCDKTAHWLKLCRTSPKYRAAWESGNGPGQNVSTEGLPGPQTTEEPRPTPSDWPCQHRGQVLRQEGCGCGGKPKIDVYECSLLGECTVYSSGKSLRQNDKRRVVVCVGCEAITSAFRDR